MTGHGMPCPYGFGATAQYNFESKFKNTRPAPRDSRYKIKTHVFMSLAGIGARDFAARIEIP
jgi:hypothetical protein